MIPTRLRCFYCDLVALRFSHGVEATLAADLAAFTPDRGHILGEIGLLPQVRVLPLDANLGRGRFGPGRREFSIHDVSLSTPIRSPRSVLPEGIMPETAPLPVCRPSRNWAAGDNN